MDTPSDLQYLADLAAADYIIRFKKMREAERRIDLWVSQHVHMCLESGCAKAVVGQQIFRHCLDHLSETEKELLDRNVEERGFEVLMEGLGPLAKAGRVDTTEAQENVREKQAALDAAFRLSYSFQEERRLRDEMLPRRLHARLKWYEHSLIESETE